MYIHTYVALYVCKYAQKCRDGTCYILMYTHTNVCIYNIHICTYLRIRINVYIYIHTYTVPPPPPPPHPPRTYLQSCLYTCLLPRLYTRTRTHTHTHAHTCNMDQCVRTLLHNPKGTAYAGSCPAEFTRGPAELKPAVKNSGLMQPGPWKQEPRTKMPSKF